jgi:hypothetical protein
VRKLGRHRLVHEFHIAVHRLGQLRIHLVRDIRPRAGLVSLAIIFLPREHSLLHGGPELFYHVGLWQLFQLLARGLVDVFFSRGFSHAGLIHFFLDASECRLVGFLLGIVFMHTCTMSRVQRDYRSIWNTAGSFRIVFIYRAVLNSLDQSAKRSISSVKQRVAFHTVGGLDYRRRTVSEDRRRVKASEVQIFTVSLNGANILSTPIQSPTS